MKTNRFLLAMLGAATLLFSACKEDIKREDSPVDEGKYQVYIYEEEANNTSHIFLPADSVRNVSIKIGRGVTTTALEVPMKVTDPSNGVLIHRDTVSFKAGEALSEFVFNLDSVESGVTYSVTLQVPDEYASLYGRSSLSLTLGADYTWVAKGTVKFIQDFLTADECDVPIEYAKEYVDADDAENNKLYRLKSPFYASMANMYPDEVDLFCDPDAHIKFIMDNDYNVVKFIPMGWNSNYSTTGWDGAYIGLSGLLIWAASEKAMTNYGGSITRQDNVYAVSTVVFDSSSGSGYYLNFGWTWDNGYPGVLSDPTAGDGDIDTLFFDDAVTIYPNQDVPYWINEDFDEVGNHNSYELYTTTAEGLELRVFLSADTIIGTFKFANTNYPTMFDDDHWKTEYYGISNFTAFPGFYSTVDDMVDGSYLVTPLATYYLRAGTVEIEVDAENAGKLKATVSATTSNGISITCVVTNIEVEGMSFAPARRGNKRVAVTKKPAAIRMINF